MIYAEQKAQDSTSMGCFAINIPDLRNTVTELLSQIGKTGLFETYTKHDIKHIDEMLLSLVSDSE